MLYSMDLGIYPMTRWPAQIKGGDKLVVSGETVRIESAGLLGAVTRRLASQSRHATLTWLGNFAVVVLAALQHLQARAHRFLPVRLRRVKRFGPSPYAPVLCSPVQGR